MRSLTETMTSDSFPMTREEIEGLIWDDTDDKDGLQSKNKKAVKGRTVWLEKKVVPEEEPVPEEPEEENKEETDDHTPATAKSRKKGRDGTIRTRNPEAIRSR